MTTIGDVNDPATILCDADTFFHQWFPGSDDDEAINVVDPIFNPLNTDPNFEFLGALSAALVQVYDLVLPFDGKKAERFLHRLRAIAGALLANRDDMPHSAPPPNCPPGPYFDAFRKRFMPAWGFFTPNRDGKWNTDPYSSGFLSYPMVAFARRVADHPVRYAQHQGDAIRFISAGIQTYQAFKQENELHLVEGDPLAYFTSPKAYQNLVCADGDDSCQDYREGAGSAIALNENLSMMQALAECALAADSALYRGSADATPERLRLATEEMPLVIAKNVAFFLDNVSSNSLPDGSTYFGWSSGEDDVSHAGFLAGCLAVVLELRTGLDSLLARAGRVERVPFSTSLGTAFANTFLGKLWRPDNTLSDDIRGSKPTKDQNGGCAGWVPYAQFDQWVWRRSKDTTFNPLIDPVTGTPTPNLNVANHGALLRYREFSSDSTRYLRDFAGQNWVVTPAPLAAGQSRPTRIYDQKWLLVLSGVVIADLRGEDGEWGRQTVSFMPDMAGSDDPTSTSGPLNWAINRYSIPKPAGSPGRDYLIRFSIEQWAPFAEPNAVFNASQSMNCGFAVDLWRPNHFGSGTDVLTNQQVTNIFSGINADLAVREKNAYLHRLGYRVALLGKIVFVGT